jgi:hypothetical protein
MECDKMTSILPFLREAVFEPEQTRAMSLAFDRACLSIKNDRDGLVREVLAKCILAHAQQGEKDPDRLCDAALAAFGIQQQRAG